MFLDKSNVEVYYDYIPYGGIKVKGDIDSLSKHQYAQRNTARQII